jgi:anti-anti-sigma regulatory factor
VTALATHVESDTLVVVPTGDLEPEHPGDIGLGQLVRASLDESSLKRVVIDLGEVPFANIEAIAELVALRGNLRMAGVSFRITNARIAVSERMRLCGVLDMLQRPPPEPAESHAR